VLFVTQTAQGLPEFIAVLLAWIVFYAALRHWNDFTMVGESLIGEGLTGQK